MNKRKEKPQVSAAPEKAYPIKPAEHQAAKEKDFGYLILDMLKYDSRYLHPGERNKLEKLDQEQIANLKALKVIE